MCQSASYVLYVVAKFDGITTNYAWQLKDRDELFYQMKVSLSEWIVRQDVVGGSSFGGNIPRSELKMLTKFNNRGERELVVCQNFS